MKVSRLIVIGLTLCVVGYLVYFFRGIVTYVLLAWVISMIGDPIMTWLLKKGRLNRLKLGSSIAAIITLLFFISVITTLFLVFVPLIVEQARNLAGVDYNSLGRALSEPITQLSVRLYDWGIINELKAPDEQIRSILVDWFDPSQLGNVFGSVLGLAGNIFITIFSILFIAFFFLKEQGLFINFMKAVVPHEHEDGVVRAIADISKLLTRYFGGIFLQMSAITLFVTIGLMIFGIKNALLIGFFAAVINVIPYLGPIIGAAFGVFISISANLNMEFYSEMLPMIGTVVLIFACMQILDNFLLQPFIFSNSVEAHPLEIFIVILAGSQLGGILGMVLAIPVYTVLRVIAKVFLSEFKVVQKITGGMNSL